MEDSRRNHASMEMGVEDYSSERSSIERAKQKEEERQLRKAMKREALQSCMSYRMMEKTAKYMDKYCLDPLIGLIPSGIGDMLTTVFVLPYIYFSLFKVKSIPLTLAVIANILWDVLLGMIPFFIGDLLDFFHRSYVANLKMIVGYVNDDPEVVHSVRKKAFWSFVVILILCYLIYLMVKLVIWAADMIAGLF